MCKMACVVYLRKWTSSHADYKNWEKNWWGWLNKTSHSIVRYVYTKKKSLNYGLGGTLVS